MTENAIPPEAVFRFSNGHLAIPILAAMALAGIGVWLLRKDIRRWGYPSLFMATVLAVIVAPNMYCDYIAVTDTGYTINTGFFFAPNRHRFSYSDVEFVLNTTRKDVTGHDYHVWEVHYVSGTTEDFPLGDLWRLNQAAILRLLHQHGVRCRG